MTLDSSLSTAPSSSKENPTAVSIFAEAQCDPPPAIDAEALAQHLFLHAESARQRTAALEARLHAEEAAEALARAESDALRAELRQYKGWIDEEIEGGTAYRLSKLVNDERERRANLESAVTTLRGHLAGLSEQLKVAGEAAKGETLEQQQARTADEALSALERLRRISASGAATATTG